jgi:hypothetical protein
MRLGGAILPSTPDGLNEPLRVTKDAITMNLTWTRYEVVSVEKSVMPDGTEADDWYRYVLSSGRSRITGFHRGSLDEVKEYATNCVEEFNLRSVRGKSARTVVPSKKK